jgi:phosphohistidine phosphatase
VLCSSAARTCETLELLALDDGSTVRLEDELHGASADTLLGRLRAVPDGIDSVLLIGHNPGLQDLALLLAAAGDDLERIEAKFPTAALATLSIATATWERLAPGDAELTAYVVPKELS